MGVNAQMTNVERGLQRINQRCIWREKCQMLPFAVAFLLSPDVLICIGSDLGFALA
jgi:hypothetical protein